MAELVIVALLLLPILVRWRRSGKMLYFFTCLPISRGYAQLWHRWTSNGMAPVPAAGPAILVSNHTCSADPMFLQSGFPRVPCYLTAREHYNVHPIARWMMSVMGCVPVVRGGRDAHAALLALRRVREGHLVVIFPEGNLSGVRRNRLRPGKHGAALLALLTRAPVYPAYIHGGPRTEKLLKAWVWPPPGHVRVIYGRPIDLSAYYDRPRTRQLLHEVTELLMDRIKALQPRPRRAAS
jgi:1-acyl-sn-glycerol-3-phosphate acyltransferase